jgi:hypothetical protein
MKFQWNRDFPEELKELFVNTLRSDVQAKKKLNLDNVNGFLSALVRLQCTALEFPGKESEKQLQSVLTKEVVHQLQYYLQNKKKNDKNNQNIPHQNKTHESNDRIHDISDLIYLIGVSGLLNPSSGSFTEVVIVPSSSSISTMNSLSELNSLVLRTAQELFPVVDENDFKSMLKG